MAENKKVYEDAAQGEASSSGQSERVKVFEQKNKARPIWMWLLPLILALILGAWLLSRNHTSETTGTAQSLGYVNFDTDQATLTADSKATLDRAAELMKQNSAMRLRVQGFTDSTGDPAHNVALSNQRSDSVTQYLTSKGIDKARLHPQGFGESNPVASNATSDGKASNRRVELFQE